MPDKALTWWDPWGSLTARGIKTVETRPWRTSHRGPLWVHVARRDDLGGIGTTSREFLLMLRELAKAGMPCACGDPGDRHRPVIGCLGCDCLAFTPSWPLGQVIGSVDVVDCVPMVDYSYLFALNSTGRQLEGLVLAVDRPSRTLELWHPDLRGGNHQVGDVSDQWPWGHFAAGRFAWFMKDAELLDAPIPARGRQQLWTWPGATSSRR